MEVTRKQYNEMVRCSELYCPECDANFDNGDAVDNGEYDDICPDCEGNDVLSTYHLKSVQDAHDDNDIIITDEAKE